MEMTQSIKRALKTIASTSILVGGMFAGTSALAFDEEISETRDVSTFSRIVIAGAVEIDIKAGESQELKIITEEDYMDRVETTVRGDTLTIRQRGRRWRSVDLTIEISMDQLESLVIEGAADANITGLDVDEFELIIEGAGDVNLEGECVSAHYEINGAGDVDAQDLECKDVEIEINGAGDADVFASESIDAELNGIGNVEVYGNPKKVRPRIHGFGSFELK